MRYFPGWDISRVVCEVPLARGLQLLALSAYRKRTEFAEEIEGAWYGGG